MKAYKNIQEKVEQAFKSIEDLERAKANPFLFTRIEQRMRSRAQLQLYGSWMYKLAMVLILFIAINVYSYSKLWDSSTLKASSSQSTDIDAFAKEYGLEQNADQI